jgi:hypothetical protein
MKPVHFLKAIIALLLAIILSITGTESAEAFCGFYVAKADTNLYNQASQVIIARKGKRTVLTLANDYQGKVKDFALVVPVPVVLKEEQVKVGEPKIIQRLDGFSAPRLVQYFDRNPCETRRSFPLDRRTNAPAPQSESISKTRRDSLGVTVEAKFSVGEYDIVILSAKESNGLEKWLRQNNYKIPRGASRLLNPYIKKGMKFFVAKVNLKEFSKQGFESLRPLMIAYEASKFMLPIRLGMINGQGEQDLIVYLLSPQGQTELTNYRTVKIPSNVNIPEFVEKEFNDFYKSMFTQTYQKENRNIGVLEYAWDMRSCDPCSSSPLTPDELRKAGVFWDTSNVFITRLHVRYTRNKFPQDLQFQNTANRRNFQGRYVIRRPYRGDMECKVAENYQRSARNRQEQEAQTLASLTGWNISKIRSKIDFMEVKELPWWRRIFP